VLLGNISLKYSWYLSVSLENRREIEQLSTGKHKARAQEHNFEAYIQNHDVTISPVTGSEIRSLQTNIY